MFLARASCVALLLAFCPRAFAQESSSTADAAALHAQWWTGPLVAPSPAVFAAGIVGLEPYFLDKRGDGAFDNNGTLHSSPPGGDQLRSFTSLQYGVTGNFSVQIVPSFAHSLNGSAATGLADLPIRVKYRWFSGGTEIWQPSLTTTAGITFPIGRYENLRKSSDGFGSGAYMAMQQALLQSVFLTGGHANRLRLWGTVSEPLNSVSLHGVTTYGTAPGYYGVAVLGPSAELGIADEFAIDRRWVLALDVVQDFGKGAHLRGAGFTGAMPDVETSGFSLAPAIEFNISQALGIIAGAQVTTYGRNWSSTVIPQVAVNMFF